MRHKWLTCLAVLMLSCGARAETMRCGSKLVSVGDRSFEVLRKCGEPDQREEVGYLLDGYYDRRELRVEEWIYGPSSGMFSILTFEGNRLVRIETQRAN